MCMLILEQQMDSQKKNCWSQPANSGGAHYCVCGVGRCGRIATAVGTPVCACVWVDPLLYSMALWDCCVFKLESGLIGGYEWAEGLQGDREASGGGFCRAEKQRPAALDENQTHSLVIGQGRGMGEGHRGGSIPHSLLHRQDSNSGQRYTSGLATHIVFGMDWNC